MRKKLFFGVLSAVCIVTAAFAFAQAYPEGIVAYWRFDEKSGVIAGDAVGNNAGIVHGAIWMTGQVGAALSFDGVDDYVDVGTLGNFASSLDGNGQCSFECWLKTDLDTRLLRVMGVTNGEPDDMIFVPFLINTVFTSSGMVISKGNVAFSLRDAPETGRLGGHTYYDTGITDGEWHHVVTVFDGIGATVQLYIDGEQQEIVYFYQGNPLDFPSDLAYGFTIGASRNKYGGPIDHFDGEIDEVAIYNRLLTEDEIQQHYRDGLNGAGYRGFKHVDIDIKPGSFPNSINLGSNGSVPVAILSTSFYEFDATTVDPTTVTLAGAGVRLRGKGTPMYSFQDVNGDLLTDLVVHVETEALELSDGDTEAVVRGETFDGMLIRGTDTVRIVPQH